MHKLLVINPGSTSTKIAVYQGSQPIFVQVLRHSGEELARYERIYDQYQFRKKAVLEALAEAGIQVAELDAVVGRGGLLRPIPGGTYSVNEAMLADLRVGISGEHASNLGGLLAHEIAHTHAIPAYIVDPVVVDELEEVARLSGLPGIQRVSIFHALNQKAIARRAAADLGQEYEGSNFVVAHLGGGISVGAHAHGRVIDVNNAFEWRGAVSPERTGGLPVLALAELCLSGKYSEPEVRRMLVGNGGLMAYLGTNDGVEVGRRIAAGEQWALLVYRAMAYQIAKEIGSAATVLRGQVDAIVLTGGLAYDQEYLVPWIKEKVAYIAPVMVYPGEDELSALAEGALRVLTGQEEARVYAPAPDFTERLDRVALP